MNRKKVMESSSASSEDDDEREDEKESDEVQDAEAQSASESSSDDDEFDSADDRVNIVPNDTPSTQAGSSEDSESDDDEEEEAVKLAIKPPESEKIQGIQSFNSDVESEYETESGSESEGSMQKAVGVENSIEVDEALPLSQKKAKKDGVSANQSIAEDGQFVRKGKDNALKQQQELKPARVNKEVNVLAMKGQRGAGKQTVKDSEQSQSLKDEKKGDVSAKKRKPELSHHDGETDSADSIPVSKRRKDGNATQTGKAGVATDKTANTASDTHKEIAKKTLSDPFSKPKVSRDVLSKLSTAEVEPRQQKKAILDASNGPSSPQKQKKPHVWSTDEEITMASEILNRVKMGLEVPIKRSDDFWLTLSEVLHEKWGVEFSRDQVSEKLRRMKQRYRSAAQKIKKAHESHKPYKHKNDKEQNLFDLWSQIWGRAEVTTLDDQQAARDLRKEPSKSSAVVASLIREGKTPTTAPKSRPAARAKASKDSSVPAVENSVERDALVSERITTVPVELDKAEAPKGDYAMDVISSVPDESTALSKDLHKLLQEKIHTTLVELQEWSKNSMESWMTKALALIENSVKAFGDQARHMSMMGMSGGTLPMRFCDATELQFVHGEQAFQQQWYELHLQELNIYSLRLELMQKECKLKQEQLKLQLQLEREK